MEARAADLSAGTSSDAASAHAKFKGPSGSTASETHIKDTIESILVAFILAFIFRTFVVEAFVIPTGSMATTLLGAQMRMHCADCGYTFDVNYSPPGNSPEDAPIPADNPASLRELYCPNCGYRIPSELPGDPAFKPPIRYGDRILVLKYAYLFQQPERWDVVVFKSPAVPDVYDYGQNYIKRLVGRGNESVMILDGDVYVGAHDALPADMRIQTKPRAVQEAMWRLVHDNDFLPRRLNRAPDVARSSTDAPWSQPWTTAPGQSGWTVDGRLTPAGGGRRFVFTNAVGRADLVFDADANPRAHALSDWMIYDFADTSLSEMTPVADLKLKLAYTRTSGDGVLRLMLSKYDRTFIAEIGPVSARLLVSDGRVETELIPPRPIGTGVGRTRAIAFQNVDYRVGLRIDDRDIFQTTPEQYAPNVDELLGTISRRPPRGVVRISAEKQSCEVRHVSLWRDVYYLNRGNVAAPLWASPENIVRLGSDEYFVLGDNSLRSSDARYWTSREAIDLPAEDLTVEAGRVPGRFLLGKAFFVYWPAGYRPLEGFPALVPNFGDMRFIN